MGAPRIPIAAAKRIADEYGQSQVVIVTFDKDGGGITHVVTYGRTVEECEQAAKGGNFVKRALSWPESLCNAKPARARAAQFCEHANEVPGACPCNSTCYCKRHTCRADIT